MVEVFKTDVDSSVTARQLITAIVQELDGCRANFDLEDCDRILRVCREAGPVDAETVIALLHRYGYAAQVLEDTVIPTFTP